MRCLRQLLRRAHPNGGNPELARTACGAVSRQVRKQMLSCFVLIVRIRIMRRMRQLLRRAIPEWESGGNWKSGTHRRKLFCQKANARVGFCGRLASPHPIAGRRSPSAPHTMPTITLPVGSFAILCLPRSLFLHAVRFMNGGAVCQTSAQRRKLFFLTVYALPHSAHCMHFFCALSHYNNIVGGMGA